MVGALALAGRDELLVRRQPVERPRLVEGAGVAGLRGGRQVQSLAPGGARAAHRFAAGLPELPDVVATVGDPAAAGQQSPVDRLAHVHLVEPARVLLPLDRVVLVAWLAVKDRLDGGARVVGADHGVVGQVAGAVAGLEHVEVEPGLVMQPFGGGMPGADPLGHGAPHRPLELRIGRTVAAEDPDDGVVAIAPAKELAVGARVLRGEHLRAHAPQLFRHLVAPRGEHADEETERPGPADDVVYVREVRLVWPRGIVLPQGEVAIGVRGSQTVELGQRHGLDHREPLGRPIGEVEVGLLAVEAVEQLPGGIAQVEERGIVGPGEVAAVRANL